MNTLRWVLRRIGHGAGLVAILAFLAILGFLVIAYVYAFWEGVTKGTWLEAVVLSVAVGIWLCFLVAGAKEWWSGRL